MVELQEYRKNQRENMTISKLSIDIKNCYGITELKQDFILANKNPEYRNERVIQIYAPNGTMKTSLTKCFKDYKDGLPSKDKHQSESGTKIIQIDDKDIEKEQIFVVESYLDIYTSPNISKLLLNNNLKKEYENVQAPIVEKENNLRQKINLLLENIPNGKSLLDDIANSLYPSTKALPQYTYNGLKIIKDIVKDFNYRKVAEDEHIKYSKLDYYTLFHEKVVTALSKPGVQKAFASYFSEYKQFVNNSKIFRFVENGTFDHLGAENIRKALSLDNFFNANHGITLSIKEDKDKYSSLNINSDKELREIIEKEKQSIESNEELKKSWTKVEKALGANSDVRNFASYIKNNIWLINNLTDLEFLRKQVIASYFLIEKEAYDEYISIWENQESKIDAIRAKAKSEKTKWDEVIKIFHNRFHHIPYKVEVNNNAPTILGEETAILSFKHNGHELPKEELITILSEGEKRTLYLLNIIFDLLTLQEENTNQDKILIIDDIVDSFDYKNKHAILEYIYDITDKSNIYLIMLTHSFDFYRSVANMFQLGYGYIAEKNEQKISLEKYEEKDLDPCKSWLKIETSKDFISSMALIRNLCDYSNNNKELKDKLNKVLHYPIKNNNHEILLDLYTDIKTYLMLKPTHTISSLDINKTFFDNVLIQADHIVNIYNNEHLNLQDKVILSIALRLLLEQKIIDYCNHNQIVLREKDFRYKQTRNLINKVKPNISNIYIKRLLDIINIISSNHIHINSFMYEPLLDIYGGDLIKWYKELVRITL
jgi:ABC-type cobalamin/Fe3+-siderophores transport system ATPase subunit